MFLSDLCMCIPFHVHLFPIEIILFIFKRKALQTRCDEAWTMSVVLGVEAVGGAGKKGKVRSRVARTDWKWG